MLMIKKGQLILFLRIAGSLALLLLLLYKYGGPTYIELSSIQRGWFLEIAIFVHFSEKLLRIYNLNRLLKFNSIKVKYWKLVQVTLVSSFWGFFIPSDSGPDLVRIFHLKKISDGFSKPTSATLTLNLSSFCGYAVLVLTAIVLLIFFGYPYRKEVIETLSILSLSIMFGFFFVFSKRANKIGVKILDFRICRILGPVRDFLRKVLEDTRAYVNLKTLFSTVLIASAVMILASIKIFFLSRCVKIDISLLYFILFVPSVAFVTSIPISFAGIGLRESAFIFFLGTLGIPDERSFSTGLLATGLNILFISTGGVLSLIMGLIARKK